MKKNGFVFVESIVVLVVVALSLAMLLSSYSLVQRKTKEKEFYDKSSDKYLLYAISDLGTDDTCSYSIRCKTGDTVDTTIEFRADVDNLTKTGATNPYFCKNTKLGRILYSCDDVLKSMQVRSIYVVKDVSVALKSSQATNIYDNGVIEYMKTLKKCNDENTTGTAKRSSSCTSPISYMIGVFERGNNDLYYASINLSGNVDSESRPRIETEDEDMIEPENNGFKVTFFANGGNTCSPDNKMVTYDGEYGELCSTTRSGYDFKGWYLEPELVYRVDPTTIVKTARNHTLYAKWEDVSAPTCSFTVTSSGVTMTYYDNVGVTNYGLTNLNTETYNSVKTGTSLDTMYYGWVKDASGNKGNCQLYFERTVVATYTKKSKTCNESYGASGNYCTSQSWSGLNAENQCNSLCSSICTCTDSAGASQSCRCECFREEKCTTSTCSYSGCRCGYSYAFGAETSSTVETCTKNTFDCNASNKNSTYVTCTPLSYKCSTNGYTKIDDNYCYFIKSS